MIAAGVEHAPRGRGVVWGLILLAAGVVIVVAVVGRGWIEESWWLRRLASADHESRREALQELVRLQSRRAVPALLEILTSETTRHLPVHGPIVCALAMASEEEWYQAVEKGLEELAPCAAAELADRFQDTRPRVRLWALHIVQAAGPAGGEYRERLLPSLCDGDPLVRQEAVWAVAILSGTSEPVLDWVRVRLRAASGAACELDGMVEALVLAVRVANEEPHRGDAIVGRAVDVLIDVAGAPGDSAARAAEALASFVDPVRPLPPDVQSGVRRAVVRLLGRAGPARAAVVCTLAREGIVDSAVFARIRAIVATASPAVRRDAAEWLGSQVSSDETVSLLGELVADEHEEVREAAAVALAEMGEPGRDVILALPPAVQRGIAPALTKRLDDIVTLREVGEARIAGEVEFLGRLAGVEQAALPLLRRLSVAAGDRVAFTALEILDRLEADKSDP